MSVWDDLNKAAQPRMDHMVEVTKEVIEGTGYDMVHATLFPTTSPLIVITIRQDSNWDNFKNLVFPYSVDIRTVRNVIKKHLSK